MSIYKAIIELEYLLKRYAHHSEKKIFVEEKLKQLRKSFQSPSLGYFHKIYEQLETEIRKNSPSPYQLRLIKVRDAVFAVIKKQESLQSKERNFSYKRAREADEMLQQIHRLGGTLILPIQHSKDIRSGNSQGMCSGYITEWALCLLNGKKPFGINPKEPPPFKPVSMQVRRFFPDLNHLAPLTERIFRLQDLYGSRLWSGKIADRYSAKPVCKQNVQALHFHKNTDEIANKLVALAKQNTQEIFQLSLLGLSGHSIGFYRDENKNYHFLDANKCWFIFNSSKEFKNFLPFYFKKLDYESRYWSHMINSYSVEGTNNAILALPFISANIRYKINQLYTNFIVSTKKMKEGIYKFIAVIYARKKTNFENPSELHLSYNNNILSNDDLGATPKKTPLHGQKIHHNSAGILDLSFITLTQKQKNKETKKEFSDTIETHGSETEFRLNH